MALIMVLRRWLWPAGLEPDAAPAGTVPMRALTPRVGCAAPVLLAPIHAPPPDRGR